jgi:large subunit ribosomal protein L4
MKYSIHNQKAEVVGEIELSDKVFGVAPKEELIHQVLVAQMANGRIAIANTKDRSEVRGGGKKPWRQKGTGRARVGSSRNPIWRGGGVVFGPTKDRNFSKDINKKMRQKALCMVLSDKVTDKNLIIMDSLEVKDFKTKVIEAMISELEQKILQAKGRRSILVMDEAGNEKFKKSAANLPNLMVINLDNINIADLLKYKYLIMTADAVKKLNK